MPITQYLHHQRFSPAAIRLRAMTNETETLTSGIDPASFSSVIKPTNDLFRYFLSGGMDLREGILKLTPDKYHKYNLRSKIDFAVNKWVDVSNNTSFYGSSYSYQGSGDVQDTFAYSNRL